MKIGILTFHRAINYGAFLQAFALKHYLEGLGHHVEIVDYWPAGHANVYKLLNLDWKHQSFVKILKALISFALGYSRRKKRKDKMEYLVQKYFNLSLSPKYEKPEDLSSLDYDCVVYGSDQIWWKSTIPGYEGFDPVYWGEYVNPKIKKVAYAPSMGIIDLTQDDKLQIQKWLKNFNSISVRETELCQAIQGLTDKNISVVLDPVFLLSKEEWEKYCVPINRSKYILYYNLLPSKEADEFLKRLQDKWGYDVIEITGSVNFRKIGKRYIQTADAFEFISYIKSAEFVVTSSFHGTAFSILFEKQFYVVGMGKKVGRVKSLLELLKIDDRVVGVGSSQSKSLNYIPVNSILSKEIQKSYSFLTKV